MDKYEHIHVNEYFTGGAQHRVARLRDNPDRLIKVPHTKGRLWDRATKSTVQTDIEILREAKIPLPKDIIIHGPCLVTEKSERFQKHPYAIEMDWVEGRIFREIDLDHAKLKEQMSEVLSVSIANRSKIGSAIDFLGGEAAQELISYLRTPLPGQLGAYNFRVTGDQNLTLIDTNLLDPRRAPQLIKGVINSMIDLQHTLMSELVGSKNLQRDVQRSNHSKLIGASAYGLFQFSRAIEAVKRTFRHKEIPLG